jgi:membrane protease YdiL (CAAX protease family)
VKKRIDTEIARLLRIILVALAAIFTLFGVFVMPLVPGPRDWNWAHYAFRLSPILAATMLMLPAGWLRRQEALDSANETTGGGSQINSGTLYDYLFALGVVGIVILTIASL